MWQLGYRALSNVNEDTASEHLGLLSWASSPGPPLSRASPLPGLLSRASPLPGLPSPGPPLPGLSSPGPALLGLLCQASPLPGLPSPGLPLCRQVQVYPQCHFPSQSLLVRPPAALGLRLKCPWVFLWAFFAEESAQLGRCRADDSVRQILHKEAWVFISQTYLQSCVLLKIFKTCPRAKIKGLDLCFLG